MHMPKLVFSILAIFFCSLTNAQKTALHAHPHSEYFRGVNLYKQGMYELASVYFKKSLEDKDLSLNLEEKCHYYLSLNAVKLNKKNGNSLALNFEKNYPNSNLKNKLFLEIGDHYYKTEKATSSLEWYQKVSLIYITPQQKEIYTFKLAYSLFLNKKYPEAKQYFLSLINSPNYASEAIYFYGYISYVQEDYKTSQDYFKKIETNEKYHKEISYYLTHIFFKQKRHSAVIKKGTKLLKICSEDQIPEISKMIGESYVSLKKYAEAIPYLKKYKGPKNLLRTHDHYSLGYAYFKINDFENAILTFNKCEKNKDSIAQSAYYYLAASYLRSEQKSEALHAFKNCSEMDFNQNIKEDAWFNYVKLSYEIGNPYKNTAEVLQDFVKTHPNSSKANEINKLIVNSYMDSKEYEGALAYYSKQQIPKDKIFQQATLYRALQLFKESRYRESLNYLKSASNQIYDAKIQAIATYWKAETFYKKHNFKKALVNFKHFFKQEAAKNTLEYKNINYAAGYTYFKLKQYDKAKENFEVFVKKETTDKLKVNDSYTRIGDCNFISKKYWAAIEAYNKVIKTKGIDDDYAQYQKAISYGFINRNHQKIKNLLSFSKNHPQSSYRDDALYELGNAYINAKRHPKAIHTFDELIRNHKQSVYIPKALLKQGLLYFNNGDSEASIKKYKYIVKTYPKLEEAQQAISNARQVYINIDQVDEYAHWVKDINYSNITNADLDNTMFEAAENKYLKNNFNQAITSLKKYLTNFPEGLHVLKANFYSAEANFNIKKVKKASTHYQFIISQSTNDFTEQSLVRLSQIYLEQNLWTEASSILKRLEKEANFPQNIIFAQSNLMKGLYKKEACEETIIYAEKVVKNKKTSKEIKSDAYTYIGRSAIKINHLKKAQKAYAEVLKIASGVLKAEALYYDAYFKHLDKKHKASNEEIQKLTSNFASYKHWGIKGLILMAKNNHELNDSFQATYILESIIKNYGHHEDLVKEAQTILKNINSKNGQTIH